MPTQFRSLRVPATVVQRVVRFIKWATPFVMAGLVSLIGLGWSWIIARVDIEDVGDAVAPVAKMAKAAQATAHSAASVVPTHQAELVALWREVCRMHGELEVLRRYSRQEPATRMLWIEHARKFYAAAYDADRDARPNDPPSKSADRARRADWRPPPRDP